jgi:uncharacterized protein YkwD
MTSARSSLVLLAVLAMLMGLPAAAQAGPAGDSQAPGPAAARSARPAAELSTTLQRLLERVNRVRADHGRKPLRATVCLTSRVAQPWARHMASTEKMVHQDLSTVFKTCPGLTRVGENIAAGYPTAKAVMRAWMRSPGHRHNILDRRFRKIGLGLARSADGTPYWVQDFGR